jgi:hypothetical protein
MGNNPLVQFVIQPILVGVIFHFIMGFVLDFKIEGKTNCLCKKTMVLQTLLGHLET